jgi:hypothetical protein
MKRMLRALGSISATAWELLAGCILLPATIIALVLLETGFGRATRGAVTGFLRWLGWVATGVAAVGMWELGKRLFKWLAASAPVWALAMMSGCMRGTRGGGIVIGMPEIACLAVVWALVATIVAVSNGQRATYWHEQWRDECRRGRR